jgi:hypothetical protein
MAELAPAESEFWANSGEKEKEMGKVQDKGGPSSRCSAITDFLLHLKAMKFYGFAEAVKYNCTIVGEGAVRFVHCRRSVTKRRVG